eukprot:TRINITY_DN111153_c0_g1_i1.p1 TRINITY_DN111153_c0_g1~~TRINITY_DN111153_c0_g1_i1.p1  ORF type:complete len:1203 (-),score=287.37 TRINITY_DN111153_c0_g1_i1:90-3698(-)
MPTVNPSSRAKFVDNNTLPYECSDGRVIANVELPEDATTVLLGECTHGTEEFYRLRAEICKYLIEVRGFNIILCESDWTFMWHVNQYIHRKKSNMFPDNVRFPDWMWKNRPFYDLIEWMRKRASSDGPYLFGMDCYCREESKEEALKFFDFHDREGLGREFRSTCFPVERPEKWPNILAKLQWEIQNDTATCKPSVGKKTTADGSCGGILLGSKKFRGCSKLDQFNVEQNLECMIAADEYYSKQRLEPPGSRASWNARDQHMMTTILRLRAQAKELFGVDEKELRIAVWAHNSHVGDATSTPSGGETFERNEKWNLGQMCRNTLENTFIVGFYSYQGEVRAARKWGGASEVMTLQPAVKNSFEYRLHEWFRDRSCVCPLRRFCAEYPADSGRYSYTAGAMPLHKKYRAVHPAVRVSREMRPDADSSADMEVEGTGEAKRRRDMLDPSKSFTAVERVNIGKSGSGYDVFRIRIGDYDEGQHDGCWVTEYTALGSRTIHCLPADVLDSMESGPLSAEKACMMTHFPSLQRWVGVNYHPETEISSHYGEMIIGKCYDLVVYVDKTKALDVDLRPTVATPVSIALQAGAPSEPVRASDADTEKSSDANMETSPSAEASEEAATPAKAVGSVTAAKGTASVATVATAQHNRRLMMEYRRILKSPIEFIETRPLESNVLEWHFVIHGNQEPYMGGKYHGILEFPEDFPMKPPSIKLLTPSGRFEINKRICLSMSDFHKESWNPSWTVEKILIGLMSFMYEESAESIGSILESKADRKRYAAESTYFNAQNEIYVELFDTPDEEEAESNMKRLRKIDASDLPDNESEKACRYCLVDSGELVAPCDCRGSSKWVHLGCLRQWQKSVVLTQSTHPRYQTNIDEICNVCFQPFKGAYKPPSRHERMLEYTGDELPKLLQKGNLLVSSRHKSEKNMERMRNWPKDLQENIGHFSEAVYFIALFDKFDSSKRGGGPVLGVNLVRKIEEPLQETSRPILGGAGFGQEATAYPRREWRQKFEGYIQTLQDFHIVSPSCVEHFLGGPVEPAEAFAMVEIGSPEVLDVVKQLASDSTRSRQRQSATLNKLSQMFEILPPHKVVSLAKKLRVKNNIFFGELSVVMELLVNVYYHAYQSEGQEKLFNSAGCVLAQRPLKIFWGYASWNATQLLGEIARRSWGLVISEADLNFETWEQTAATWEVIVDKSLVAKESEYSAF